MLNISDDAGGVGCDLELGGLEGRATAHYVDADSRRNEWIETGVTLLFGVAALLTAWAAFQTTKWNGAQADNTLLASAAGNASARQTTVASLQRDIDLATFLEWLQAYRSDVEGGRAGRITDQYVPDPSTLSGFIAARFRPEFRPAFYSWIATGPLVNSSAPATPFEMDEYILVADTEIDELTAEARKRADMAREANDRGDSYVLMTVMFAVGLVFAGIGSKLEGPIARTLLLVLACVIVVVTAAIMATFPVEI